MKTKIVKISSLIVIVLTLVAFFLALITKGFTEELFLELGVFLVSAKLIIMAGVNSTTQMENQRHLKEINKKLEILLKDQAK